MLSQRQLQQFWLKLIRDLSQTNFLPAICFIFSKAKIDTISTLIMQSVDLNSKSESIAADQFFRRAISQLKKADQDLPQVILLFSIFTFNKQFSL